MLYRKLKAQILDWIQNGVKPMMITGARQVGKSYLIRETLKESGVDYVEFNFLNDVLAKETFESLVRDGLSSFKFRLSLLSKRSLKKGAVVFIDEVQEVKEVLTILKFLATEGDYRYILSGSLLGIELTNLKSAPVGYLDSYEMYPLDLEEFFIANGLTKENIEYLRDKFLKKEPIDNAMHEILLDTFYRYLAIGGMPEAVQTYLDTQDMNKVMGIHKNVVNEYKRDFTKYEEKSKLKLIKTYEMIPSELNSKNKRYQLSDLGKDTKFDRYENSFNWLIDAGVAIPTYNVTEFQLPLAASKKSSLFKFFLSDVGLLSSMYGRAAITKMLNRGESVNCGAIYENFIAQELAAHGFPTYYFNSKKHGEVDFLIEYEGNLLPIEVKSGKDYQRHSALSHFMQTPYFDQAIVFSNYNVSTRGKITYLPIYMAMFLRDDQILPKLQPIDLSKLSVH